MADGAFNPTLNKGTVAGVAPVAAFVGPLAARPI